MTRLLLMIGAAAMALASPAVAQHQGHVMPAPAKPAPKKAAPKKPAPKKAAPKKAAPKKAAPKKAAPKKAAPNKAAPEKPVASTPSAQPDPHAGHVMPQAQPDPHAGHVMGPAVDPPVAPPPPEAFSGPDNAADRFWDPRSMARSRSVMRREHGALPAYRLLLDRMETSIGNGGAFEIDGEAWYGGDIDKAWVKAEAEGEWGEGVEEIELQGLWSHAIDPWFDLQTGVRVDLKPATRAYLVAGVQGLAPYWIHVDAAAFLSDQGDLSARLEAEHDVRITQKLILQPRAELEFALQDVAEEGLGAGLSTVSLGARLRYQIRPEFAPYVGLSFDRPIGDSRRFRRLAGDGPGGVSLVAGLRTWF